MTNERRVASLKILRSLLLARVRYVVVGSFGLELFLRDALAHDVKDCDVVIARDRANLARAVGTLTGLGFELRAGKPFDKRDASPEPAFEPSPLTRRANAGDPAGQEAHDDLDFDALAGTMQLRATSDGQRDLQLDLLHEPPALGWERITYAVADIEGVPVAAIETILAMGDRSTRERDRALSARVRAQVERGDLGPRRL